MSKPVQTLHVTPTEYQKFRTLCDKHMPGTTASREEVDAIFGEGVYDRLAYVETEVLVHFDGVLPADRITSNQPAKPESMYVAIVNYENREDTSSGDEL